MAFSIKQRIRLVRILLTLFYGFLLSTVFVRYVVHGLVDTIREPSNFWSIGKLSIGIFVFLSIILATYATWFDNRIILLLFGFVLIFVFILNLIFGIIRIVNTAPGRVTTPEEGTISDVYAFSKDIIELSVELLAILLAILATFILVRYIKTKYEQVPTERKF